MATKRITDEILESLAVESAPADAGSWALEAPSTGNGGHGDEVATSAEAAPRSRLLRSAARVRSYSKRM